MSDLRELYQEVILDHNRQPRNFRKIDEATHQADGYNPLCGDRVTVYAKVVDDKIEDLTFEGSGCAISTASASMLTECLRGKTVAEAEAAFESFSKMILGDDASDREALTDSDREQLGKLEVFGGVCEFPTRVKCATLVWHTLNAAIKDDGEDAVSTE